MDLNDFWQENKRWVVSCLGAFIVFLIANAVIGDSYSKTMRSVNSGRSRFAKDPRYASAQLEVAREEKATLDTRLAQLRGAMHYAPAAKFDLTGKGDPEGHWTTTYGSVRDAVFEAAYEANVEIPEAAFTWGSPVGRDEIQRALYSVSLVEHIVAHLIAAHRSVTEKDFESLGLRTISTFKMNERARGTRRSRFRREKGVTVDDLLSEWSVDFKFEADNQTVHRFLENCRRSEPKVTLASLKIVSPERPGETLTVTGKMIALAIKPIPEAE